MTLQYMVMNDPVLPGLVAANLIVLFIFLWVGIACGISYLVKK